MNSKLLEDWEEYIVPVWWAPLGSTRFVGGCLGKPVARGENTEEVIALLCRQYSVTTLVMVRQVHSAQFLMIDEISSVKVQGHQGLVEEEADAIVWPALPSGCGIAVYTADCVPLVVQCGGVAAVIHAGWRGLQAQIIEKVITRVAQLVPGEPLYVAIGPCAGREKYVVGPEFAEHFPGSAALIAADTEDFKVDGGTLCLVTEALSRLQSVPDVTIRSTTVANICTISDDAFYSYRREGTKAGRNISFILNVGG